MAGRKEPVAPRDLMRHWRQWTSIVELFARRRRARLRVDAREYEKLYKEMIAVFQSEAETADLPRRAFYGYLAELVRPWMTPRTLEQADGEILFDLWSKCENALRALGERSWHRKLGRWTRSALFWAGTLLCFAL